MSGADQWRERTQQKRNVQRMRHATPPKPDSPQRGLRVQSKGSGKLGGKMVLPPDPKSPAFLIGYLVTSH